MNPFFSHQIVVFCLTFKVFETQGNLHYLKKPSLFHSIADSKRASYRTFLKCENIHTSFSTKICASQSECMFLYKSIHGISLAFSSSFIAFPPFLNNISQWPNCKGLLIRYSRNGTPGKS